MAINPVKVPQNVYVEDRVVGPLTLRQIILMMAGAGISYVMFIIVQKSNESVAWPIAVVCWIPFFIAAAFAILKVNDLSLFRIVLLSMERMSKAPDRVWVPRRGLSIHIRTSSALDEEEENKKKKAKVPTQEDTATQIQRLSSIVDKGLEFDDPLLAELDNVTTTADRQREALASEAAVTDIVLPPKADARGNVTVDDAGANGSNMSDLSVFRDIFQPKQS